MNTIQIAATDKTPQIEGNIEEGTLRITGKSLPENPRDFYRPFSKWLQSFYETTSNEINVILDIEYFNTSTSNLLVELLRQLKNISKSKPVSVTWCYEEDDLDMEDVGNDFITMVGEIVVLEPKKPA
jgi:hypothetical protein